MTNFQELQTPGKNFSARKNSPGKENSFQENFKNASRPDSVTQNENTVPQNGLGMENNRDSWKSFEEIVEKNKISFRK